MNLIIYILQIGIIALGSFIVSTGLSMEMAESPTETISQTMETGDIIINSPPGKVDGPLSTRELADQLQVNIDTIYRWHSTNNPKLAGYQKIERDTWIMHE